MEKPRLTLAQNSKSVVMIVNVSPGNFPYATVDQITATNCYLAELTHSLYSRSPLHANLFVG
jgi:hypothetical protein